MTNISEYIELIANKKKLTLEESKKVFNIIMSGNVSENQIAGFLIALKSRGESVNEISGAVSAIREKMIHIDIPEDSIDIVGTGGDGFGTYNISTTVTFVLAGCGVYVAKHGNRSVSSLSGSSDILTELSVNINLTPSNLTKCINETNICFMFAPIHHQSFKYVANTRKELGVRTIFNLLGPLCNPGNVKNHLIGVYDKKWLNPIATTLHQLGSEKAWIVHGNDGLDELTTTDKNYITELKHGKYKEFELNCTDHNLNKSNIKNLKGGDPKKNAYELTKVLNGEKNAYRDIVLLNSSAGLMLLNKCKDIDEGIEMAKESIDSGSAIASLKKLIKITNKLK